jgi:alkylation response protein AidB-like acyl-CoA dehydrogenase
MQFELSEAQQLQRAAAKEFFAAECPMAEVRRLMETEHAYSEPLWRKMGEQGWMGMLIADEYDGAGLGLVEAAVTMEEMGRGLAPSPFLSTALLAAPVIAAAGNAEQKRKYLPPLARGEAKATLALLESKASWRAVDVSVPFTCGKLNGRKLFVTDAGVSDLLVVAARGEGGLVLAVVSAQAPGVTITRMPAMDATRPWYAVNFTSVAADDILATGDPATEALHHALDVATVGLVAEMTGGMQRVMDTTVQYAKTRRQFGRPIGQFQAVQHMCADMLLLTESSRSAAYYAAWALHEKVPAAELAVSVAKSYASEAYREVGNRGIQVHGGMGFTWENDLHLYYRRAKSSETLFGDAAFHRERIAESLL